MRRFVAIATAIAACGCVRTAEVKTESRAATVLVDDRETVGTVKACEVEKRTTGPVDTVRVEETFSYPSGAATTTAIEVEAPAAAASSSAAGAAVDVAAILRHLPRPPAGARLTARAVEVSHAAPVVEEHRSAIETKAAETEHKAATSTAEAMTVSERKTDVGFGWKVYATLIAVVALVLGAGLLVLKLKLWRPF
jgi:hypothetical protein